VLQGYVRVSVHKGLAAFLDIPSNLKGDAGREENTKNRKKSLFILFSRLS